MLSKKPVVFVDTSLFKALLDPKDDFHLAGVTIWGRLKLEQSCLGTSNFVLDETYTLLRKRCGKETAMRLRQLFIDNGPYFKISRVLAIDEADAWQWFSKDWSNLSFTDCTSFAIMKRLGLVEVATFDGHFERAGFKVVK